MCDIEENFASIAFLETEYPLKPSTVCEQN